MKNFKLMLALAVVLGAGSAFTSATKAAAGESCYKVGSTFSRQLSGGTCQNDATNPYCTYTYTGAGVAGVDQNPSNYQPVASTASKRWIP